MERKAGLTRPVFFLEARIPELPQEPNDFDAEHADNCAEGRGSFLVAVRLLVVGL